MLSVILWWLIIQLFGWVALPVAMRVFRWLPDRGYIFSKALGLLLVSYLLWFGASSGVLRNNLGGIWTAIGVVAALSAWFYWKGKETGQPGLREFLRENRGMVVTTEILFLATFAAWAVLRAYAPDKIMSAGGEKWMEIAFLNGILKSPTFPPLDPWLSGFSISYYYFGYVMMALMTRLSGVVAGIGFELYDALMFALTTTGAFGVVYNLVAGQRTKIENRALAKRQGVAYGLFGSLLVVWMGNLEGLIEALYAWGKLPKSFFEWINIPDLIKDGVVTGKFSPQNGGFWWWWRGSRVLFDTDFSGKLVPIPPISEFPFFSFLLGDNHPHKLALPFVLLAIALGLNLLRRWGRVGEQGSKGAGELGRAEAWWNPIASSLAGDWQLFILYAICLGGLAFLNTWDFPIYLGLVVLAHAAGRYLQTRRIDRDLVRETFVLGAGWLVAAVLLYIFFYIGFSSQAGGVLPYVFPPTRLPQYFLIFGPFLIMVGGFLIINLVVRGQLGEGRSMLLGFLRWWGWLLLACAALFVFVLLVVGIGYILLPMVRAQLTDAVIQNALGGLSLREAAIASLGARLFNPWLLLTLTGFMALVLANLFGSSHSPLKRASFNRSFPRVGEEKETGTVGDGHESSLASFRLPSSDMFSLLMIFLGLALTLIVEFFYLRDSFGYRMNTIFKFYYQGWVMMGCASAYSVWWMLNRGRRVLGKIGSVFFMTVVVLLVGSGLLYTVFGAATRVADPRPVESKSPPNLDGTSQVARDNPDDWAAIRWLTINVPDAPTILEATAGSYRYEGRISAFTGLPTVLGWAYHEFQWRGTYTEQSVREPEIATIYTTHDLQTALDLLHKWGVKYVIVGNAERNYISEKCATQGFVCNLPSALRKFDTVFSNVFTQGQTTIYEVP